MTVIFLLLFFDLTLAGVFMSRINYVCIDTFPLGLFIFEALYALFQALLMLGLMIFSGSNNVAKIIRFFNDKSIEAIIFVPIFVYSIIMSATCFLFAYFYRAMNKKCRR